MRLFGAICRLTHYKYQSSQRSSCRAMSAAVNHLASTYQNFDEVVPLNHYNDFLLLREESASKSPTLTQSRSLVMINSATMDIELVKILWNHCDHKICADGGANRLFDGLSSSEVAQYIPGIMSIQEIEAMIDSRSQSTQNLS